MDRPLCFVRERLTALTYLEAIQFLYSLRWFGAKFGLSNTLKLAELAGNPHQRLRFIHVAGTNGKGSTCAMLESVYRQAGLRVGLFTSPHLVSFGERIQVNRVCIPEDEVARLVGQMQRLLKEFPVDHHPTFFEVVTVMALVYFAEQDCELIIWETGLGGRLDATNIVTPLASVITNIHYDHQAWLGETLASIASEKAGIIKPGVPVVTGATSLEALDVIRGEASKHGAPLTIVSPSEARQPPLDSIKLPLLGSQQRFNAAVALATVRTLQVAMPANEDVIRIGLSTLDWAGRLQVVVTPSGGKVLLDGAHNVDGAEHLAEALKQYFPESTITLVLGILRDKNWAAMCEILAPLATRIALVPVPSERSAEPHGLAEVCHSAHPGARVDEFPSLSAALAHAASDPFLVIAGSLYLVGEAMELLRISPAPASHERGLNEWQGTGAKPR